MLRDLTEQVETQRRLIQREKLASLCEMAAAVAHEIRNPLGGIKMATRLLASGDVDRSPLSPGDGSLHRRRHRRDRRDISSLLDFTRDTRLERGEYDLAHTHPVNFNYNAALATNDAGLYTPANDHYVYYDATRGAAIGRLFNGTMQCSSCHNPHLASGIGLVGSSNYGRLCVACHKKST